MKSLLRVKLISISIAGYTFSPAIFTTLVTALLLYTMNFMGQWQYGKAEYKDNLLEIIAERKNQPEIDFDAVSKKPDEDRRFTPVKFEGIFDQRLFLYDNRILQGQVGYDVYSPFILNSGQWILVNRGFVPQGLRRDVLPVVITAEKKLSLRGVLDKIPSKGVILADDLHSAESWPVMLQYIDEDEVSEMLGQPVYDMIFRVSENCEESFKCSIPALNLDSAKNYGYTFQWYAMMLALSIIYLIFNIRKTGNSHD